MKGGNLLRLFSGSFVEAALRKESAGDGKTGEAGVAHGAAGCEVVSVVGRRASAIAQAVPFGWIICARKHHQPAFSKAARSSGSARSANW